MPNRTDRQTEDTLEEPEDYEELLPANEAPLPSVGTRINSLKLSARKSSWRGQKKMDILGLPFPNTKYLSQLIQFKLSEADEVNTSTGTSASSTTHTLVSHLISESEVARGKSDDWDSRVSDPSFNIAIKSDSQDGGILIYDSDGFTSAHPIGSLESVVSQEANPVKRSSRQKALEPLIVPDKLPSPNSCLSSPLSVRDVTLTSLIASRPTSMTPGNFSNQLKCAIRLRSSLWTSTYSACCLLNMSRLRLFCAFHFSQLIFHTVSCYLHA